MMLIKVPYRITIYLVKFISIPIYILDFAYDLFKLLLFSTTQQVIVPIESNISTNIQINIHKIQKSFTFPNVQLGRNRNAFDKIRKAKRLSQNLKSQILEEISEELLGQSFTVENSGTFLTEEYKKYNAESTFDSIIKSRKSIRNFSNQRIKKSDIVRIIELAKHTPSVCNRQSWKVHHFSDAFTISKLLSWQNGNRGWGHTIKDLLVVTCDLSKFTTSSERNQCFVDGGMFSMSIVLSAKSLGIDSCCLNQSNYFFKDIAIHRISKIPLNERIIMFIALGKAEPDSKVATSQRYATHQFIVSHN